MKKYISGLAILMLMIAGCEKKVDPVDSYGVTVELKNSGAKFITGDVELNPKDSIYFDFTITSQDDMEYVEIQKNGTKLDTFRIPSGASKNSFSKIKGYMADSAAGTYVYRVVARGPQARFLGDGGMEITVTIKPDFLFWSYRVLQVPDTVEKKNKCYYSTRDGKVYSYTEGAAVSSTIDFGYYWDTTGRGTTATGDDLKHCFYSLNASQPQLSYYDISSWTKNTTLLKKLNINFANITSSGAIKTLVASAMTTGTSSKVTLLSPAAPNNVVGFKTAGGKFGAVLIRFVKDDSPNKETQMEVDVKIEK